MSFSNDMKNELIGSFPKSLHCRIAMLSGYITICGRYNTDKESDSYHKLVIRVEDDEQEAKSVKPIESKDFNSENEIKPAPKDDPAFVNIILKTDKTSKYANDLNEFITMLENLYDVMEENANVQLFTAKVYYFNRNVDDFRDRYAGKPESSYVSYKRLLELSAHTQSIALLRTEAEKYNPYLSYGSAGYIYNPNNIQEQLGFLKTEIQQTIILLRDSL